MIRDHWESIHVWVKRSINMQGFRVDQKCHTLWATTQNKWNHTAREIIIICAIDCEGRFWSPRMCDTAEWYVISGFFFISVSQTYTVIVHMINIIRACTTEVKVVRQARLVYVASWSMRQIDTFHMRICNVKRQQTRSASFDLCWNQIFMLTSWPQMNLELHWKTIGFIYTLTFMIALQWEWLFCMKGLQTAGAEFKVVLINDPSCPTECPLHPPSPPRLTHLHRLLYRQMP